MQKKYLRRNIKIKPNSNKKKQTSKPHHFLCHLVMSDREQRYILKSLAKPSTKRKKE